MVDHGFHRSLKFISTTVLSEIVFILKQLGTNQSGVSLAFVVFLAFVSFKF